MNVLVPAIIECKGEYITQINSGRRSGGSSRALMVVMAASTMTSIG